MRYRVNVEPDDNDTLLVTCPDLPEVVTFGMDEADALVRAHDAVITALQGRIAAREDIPAPSDGPGPAVTLGAGVEAKITLYGLMRRHGWTKADLARRLGAHPPTVDRLLDLAHDSKLPQLELAFQAVGHELRILAVEAA